MEKTKLELLTLCDYATISQDNKLSIVGMFEQIYVANFPSQHPQMFIVGIIKGEPEKTAELTLSIKTPGGKDAIPPQNINVKIGPNGKSNIIAGVGNMPLSESGFYKIDLSDKTGSLGEKEFGTFISPQSAPAPSASNKYTN